MLIQSITIASLPLVQLELQQVDKHEGVHTSLAQDVSRLLKHMLLAAWVGTHSCGRAGAKECLFCESCVMWYQLALELVRFLAPLEPVRPPDVRPRFSTHALQRRGDMGVFWIRSKDLS